jgi:hypothetical protein
MTVKRDLIDQILRRAMDAQRQTTGYLWAAFGGMTGLLIGWRFADFFAMPAAVSAPVVGTALMLLGLILYRRFGASLVERTVRDWANARPAIDEAIDTETAKKVPDPSYLGSLRSVRTQLLRTASAQLRVAPPPVEPPLSDQVRAYQAAVEASRKRVEAEEMAKLEAQTRIDAEATATALALGAKDAEKRAAAEAESEAQAKVMARSEAQALVSAQSRAVQDKHRVRFADAHARIAAPRDEPLSPEQEAELEQATREAEEELSSHPLASRKA